MWPRNRPTAPPCPPPPAPPDPAGFAVPRDPRIRLEQLRFLYNIQLHHLRQTEHWIRVAEERVAEADSLKPPPPPQWGYSHARGDKPPTVHTWNCGMSGPKKPLTRDQALRALTVDQIPPCVYCTPDRDLGVLE